MSEISLPAPLWRRLAAAFYDGLLLLAIWMSIAVIEEIVRDSLLKLPRNFRALQLYMFFAGLAFFGWFWTHGGQTLGMRVWHLQVRRGDGAALRWPIAAVRYTVLLLAWGAAIYPLLLRLPAVAKWPLASEMSAVCIGSLALGLLLFQLDGQRRAPCDFIAGTVVVTVPKTGSADTSKSVDSGRTQKQ
ncbi:MAG: RDD family protein [Stenotrophobium sp.]